MDAIFLKNDLSLLANISGIAWKKSYSLRHGFKNFYRDSNNKCIDISDTDDFGNCSGDEETPNGGFIYLSNIENYDEAVRYGDFFLKKYHAYFTAMIDEIIIFYIVLKLQINKTVLAKEFFNSFPHEATEKTVFLHFAGGNNKPWNNSLIQTTFPLWKLCYQSYLMNYSGIKFKDFSSFDSYDNNLFKNFYKSFWMDLLRDFFIPAELNYPNDFTKFYLIFKFRNNMYFEMKVDYWKKDYLSFGFWFKDSILSFNLDIKEFCDTLIAKNQIFFNYKISTEGVYIYTEQILKNNCKYCFNYFVRSILKESNSPFLLI